MPFAARLRVGNVHDIELVDGTLGVRYRFASGLHVEIAGRRVDYAETTGLATDADDYDASILTLGLGLGF